MFFLLQNNIFWLYIHFIHGISNKKLYKCVHILLTYHFLYLQECYKHYFLTLFMIHTLLFIE